MIEIPDAAGWRGQCSCRSFNLTARPAGAWTAVFVVELRNGVHEVLVVACVATSSGQSRLTMRLLGKFRGPCVGDPDLEGPQSLLAQSNSVFGDSLSHITVGHM